MCFVGVDATVIYRVNFNCVLEHWKFAWTRHTNFKLICDSFFLSPLPQRKRFKNESPLITNTFVLVNRNHSIIDEEGREARELRWFALKLIRIELLPKSLSTRQVRREVWIIISTSENSHRSSHVLRPADQHIYSVHCTRQLFYAFIIQSQTSYEANRQIFV